MKIGLKHGPRKCPKYKPKIKHILFCIMFIELDKNGRAETLILPEMRVF